LVRRPNTDSTPKKPVKLSCNQLLICYAVTSHIHGNVTSVYPPLSKRQQVSLKQLNSTTMYSCTSQRIVRKECQSEITQQKCKMFVKCRTTSKRSCRSNDKQWLKIYH